MLYCFSFQKHTKLSPDINKGLMCLKKILHSFLGKFPVKIHGTYVTFFLYPEILNKRPRITASILSCGKERKNKEGNPFDETVQYHQDKIS